MQNEMDHTNPTKDEIKLIMDNALLEQEKRLTKTLGESLSDQNKLYMDHILSLNTKVTTLQVKQNAFDEKMRGFKALVLTAASASSVVSGLIGFFISQLTGRG